MRRLIPVLLTATLLTACSASENPGGPQSATTTDSAAEEYAPSQAMQPGDGRTRAEAAPAKGGAEQVRVSIPQLAYTYKLTYLLPGDKLAEVQDGHRALCEQMGPARCQLISLQRGTGEDVHAQATMQVRVASSEARSFSDAMGKSVTAAGGRNTESNIGTEEVSKQIVDTRARIKQREMLVERLTEILRTRRGTTAELIEAERSVTAAQEELEQARAWLAELSGRVAMSNFEINYGSIAASADPNSVSGQLGDATLGSATSFLIIARVLLTIAIYLAPWALIVLLGVMGVRWMRRRRTVSGPLPNEG